MKDLKLDIVMCVPGMKFNGDTLDKASLGGSETAGLMMAKELAKRGHNVNMFSNCDKPGVYDKVNYIPIQNWNSYSAFNPHDVNIVQRVPEFFRGRLASKLNVLWNHDLALVRSSDISRSIVWNVDKIITVSNYMTKQNQEVLCFDEDIFWTSRNGIELSRLQGVDLSKRNRKRLVYAARPERGLDVLLTGIMPKLLSKDSTYNLVVCGYDNTVQEMAEFYQTLRNMMDQFNGRVTWAGNLNKKDLYNLYASAGLYVYPTPSPTSPTFVEVSCITLMECAALGLPFLSSNRGALQETASGDCAMLLEGDPWTEEYQNNFVEKILEITQSDEVWNKMSNAGLERSKGLDWSLVAENWEDKIFKAIEERNSSKERLAIHFIKRSDIFAAEKCLENVDTPLGNSLKEKLDTEWGFRKSPEKFSAHYKEMGEITTDRLVQTEWREEYFDVTNEKRFHMIEQLIGTTPQIKTVLDYGCGHGWCDIYMERKIGRKWLGVDVDQGAINWSKNFSKFARNPQNLIFTQGDLTSINDPNHPSFLGTHLKKLSQTGKADCLLLTEVLEHCIDPIATVEALEKWVVMDGAVIITVPYGPREYPDYGRIKHRNHLHELDLHSLKEIFGNKPGVDILGVFETMIGDLEEPAGFYVVKYKADGKPLGRINWDRKLFLQRPEQTVGASIIAGPGVEETLHWCIRSIKKDVDGIVVVDTGMNDEGKRMLSQYPEIKVIPGPNPLEVGFEVARNTSLKDFPYDWILWVDTDEKLFGGNKIHKYLRKNIFHGYSVKQHHFAVDTTFKPDLPVRLVRNEQYKGKDIRWYGMLHEHPETDLNEGPGPSIILSDVNIAHLGYLYEEDRRKRFWRNRPLLLKSIQKYPNRILNHHFVMRDNMLLCSYEAQNNGGKVSPEMRKLCDETIQIYREHFLGKGSFLNVDSLEYYSQACRILGVGAEVSFAVNVDKTNTPTPEIKQYRFATYEDLNKELEWRAKEGMAPVLSKWW